MKQLFVMFSMIALSIFTHAQDFKQSALKATKGGFIVDFGEAVFDKKIMADIKMVDMAMVDFSALKDAKNDADSTAILQKIYKDPKNFSIVTGTVKYLSPASIMVYTKASFKFKIDDLNYSFIIVEGDGNDNSGTSTPPQRVTMRMGGHGCSSCGCDCYRSTRGCTYCGFGRKVTAPRRGIY